MESALIFKEYHSCLVVWLSNPQEPKRGFEIDVNENKNDRDKLSLAKIQQNGSDVPGKRTFKWAI